MSYCPKCGGKCGPTLIECTCPPTVKLPHRYSATVPEGSEIPVIYQVHNGGLMRYIDIIAALKASGIAWEDGE
jgi:hypothetical protein